MPFWVHAAARDASVSQSERVSLRRSTDFRRVLSAGQRVRRGGVTVVAGPGPGTEARVGLVVSKAVGNSVARNRAKRRLRHALDTTPLEQGMDYVIIAERQVVNARFSDLCGWLRHAISDNRV